MTDNHKSGTGDVLGRLDLGPFGEVVVLDDGDSDACTEMRAYDNDGNRETLAFNVYEVRGEKGDDFVLDAFENLERRLQHDPMTRPDSGGSSRSSALDGPVAFKCSECGRTCPRTWNTNPGGGSDVCKECDDGDAANGGGSP